MKKLILKIKMFNASSGSSDCGCDCQCACSKSIVQLRIDKKSLFEKSFLSK